MSKWKIDQWKDLCEDDTCRFDPLHDWTLDTAKNPYITDTAGFKPLEVQIAQFEQAGRRARFRSDMFDSSDYNEMYLHPDLRITGEDDEIDIEEKLKKQNFLRRQIIEQKLQNGERKSFESVMREYEELKRREEERKRNIQSHDTPKPPAVGAEEKESS